MSSKRRADKYLTDQNWDQEEEEEEKGEFEAASVDVLKQRTFKKAKRRIVQTGEVGCVAQCFLNWGFSRYYATLNFFPRQNHKIFV